MNKIIKTKDKKKIKEVSANEDDSSDLENNSQPKTIFWTAFVSVFLTLSVVLFFSGELNKQGESDISTFFKGLGIVLTLLFVPATIIYRLMFGKIDREQDESLYYLFALFSFVIFLYAMGEILNIFIPESLILVLVSSISSILLTIVFLKWMYKPKSIQNKKNSL